MDVMYLFDTDTISNIFKKSPSLKLIQRLKDLDPSEQYISSITIAEIVYGARKGPHTEKHLNNLNKFLLPSVNVVDFDLRSAYIAGEIRAYLEIIGNTLSFTDIQIAAIAIANQLILVTGNTKHFARIFNLKIENWL